jgi:cytochrome c oxidase subunit II
MKRSIRFAAAVCALALVLGGGASFADEAGQVIKITAKKFEYAPSEITLKKGVPATLVLTSLDRLHGFNCTDLGLRLDIVPGKENRISFVPQKSGVFDFRCDIFCGDGHDGMEGKIKVVE